MLYEAEKAKVGVVLVQFGGATTVSVERAYYYGQLNGSVDAVIPDLRRMASVRVCGLSLFAMRR